MRHLILFLFPLVLATTSYTQEITVQEWQEQAKTNIRLLPKYGHVQKNADLKRIDSTFISESVIRDGNHRSASDDCITRGFEYLNAGKIKTAMYRFNQAWLLDSTNADVFWGFGGVYFMLGDYASALKQYDEGLTIDPSSYHILTDKGMLYKTLYKEKNDKAALDKAIELFTHSYAINQENTFAAYKLSECYFLKDDCANAVKYYKQCDGKSVTSSYNAALTEKCMK